MKEIPAKTYTRQIMVENVKFNVDTNLPIPPRSVRGSVNATLARKMRHGDSILFDKYHQANSFSKHLKKIGCQCVTRQEGGKTRLWKLDPQEHEEINE